jgi:RNA polymerase sigma-70 factor (ECF subfamily)
MNEMIMKMEASRTDRNRTLEGLIEPCLQGDRGAREQLAREVIPRLRRTLTLLADAPCDVDDLIQNALISMFTGLSGFRREARFSTWLDRIAVNTARQHHRRFWHRLFFHSVALDAAPLTSHHGTPESTLNDRRASDRIIRELQHIGTDKRIALVLWAAWGYTVEEIALLSNCSIEAAKKRLQHARKELFARLPREDMV